MTTTSVRPPIFSDADRIREDLSRRLGPHRYAMWFPSVEFSVEQTTLCVQTDSSFVARWIDANFATEMREVAVQVLGPEAAVRIEVRPEARALEERAHEVAPAETPATAGRHPAADRPGSRCTFRRLDEFVVGRSNQLAWSAARQFAIDGEGASSLFIHGECGVGKTHLLQGICHAFVERTGRGHAMRYVTGEQFTNEYIAAVRTNNLEQFRRRFRKVELLVIDDVHFLSNKMRTQSEFTHTVDAIDLSGARVVLASDEHPRLIQRLTRQLVSRFLSGMVVQVETPDRQTRLELVRRLAAARGLRVNDAAVQQIATRCSGSVRELEGAIVKLAALQFIAVRGGGGMGNGNGEANGVIGLALVEQLFADRTRRQATPVRLERIIEVVCGRLSITRDDLLTSGRHRRIVLGRALVAYLGKQLTMHSYPEIAAALGRNCHSTIHGAAKRLAGQIEKDETAPLLAGDEVPLAIRDLAEELRGVILAS